MSEDEKGRIMIEYYLIILKGLWWHKRYILLLVYTYCILLHIIYIRIVSCAALWYATGYNTTNHLFIEIPTHLHTMIYTPTHTYTSTHTRTDSLHSPPSMSACTQPRSTLHALRLAFESYFNTADAKGEVRMMRNYMWSREGCRSRLPL